MGAPPLSAIPPHIVCAADYEREAASRLDPAIWAYLAGGAGDEITMRANEAAFAAHRLLPRVLSELGPDANTRVTLFGEILPHPFVLAPIAFQRLLHPDGEIASARAAGVMETPFAVSTFASSTFEDIAAAASAPLWLQLYVQPSREDTMALIRRAEEAGFRAIVLTVDAPIGGIRNAEQRAGFALPDAVRAVNLTPPAPAAIPSNASAAFAAMQHAPTWKDAEAIVRATALPVIMKGVLHPADARRACEIGIAGLVVSNHGGRVLDTSPAALEMLPGICEAAGSVPVLFDSGVRRGSDAFKAIALGAAAVLIGRPYAYALAVAGALGVAHLLRTLREELEITMALMGCSSIGEIGPHCLQTTLSTRSGQVHASVIANDLQ